MSLVNVRWSLRLSQNIKVMGSDSAIFEAVNIT
jgi:hypothetical protein